MKQVVLITGASSGIGRAAAKLFAEKGYAVYAGARRTERMDDLKALGVNGFFLDVTDEKCCEDAINRIVEKEGRIDVLVNNAGYGEYGPVETVSAKKAQAQLETNLFGAVRMVKLSAPLMRKQRYGRIINVSSAGGRAVTYLGGWYHAAKYALEAISDAMRMELSDFGIKVSVIEPGGVRSGWGGIAAENLSQSGKGTVYEASCDSTAGVFRKVYAENSRLLTSPEKAARVIFKAAQVKHPKARYLFGFGAHTLVFLHAVLPARGFDALMKKMYTSKIAEKLSI